VFTDIAPLQVSSSTKRIAEHPIVVRLVFFDVRRLQFDRALHHAKEWIGAIEL
jgi:hypothetical protein